MWWMWAGCGDLVEARLPSEAGDYAPSHLEVLGDPAPLADVGRCAECHAPEHAAWTRSAHAHASFDNPWYRVSVEALRDQVGFAESRHCGGCHDPVLLVAGQMDAAVDPLAPEAQLGVTCLGCHAITRATSDGNASVVLDLRDLPYPSGPGPRGTGDPSVEVHGARMMPDVLRSGAACGACHRGFLGPPTGNAGHLVGMDDQGSWRASPWSGTDSAVLTPSEPERATCVDCHVADHQMAGSHTALAAQVGGLEAVAERLRGAADVFVGAVWSDGDAVAPELADGPISAIDAVVWNRGTGHSFPGGTKDLQDTWLEVVVTDADGRPVAVSGTTIGDPEAARLSAVVVDADGLAVRTHTTHRIVTAAFDRTVPPFGASAVRFVLPEPARVDRVQIRLLHRRHPASMARAACDLTPAGIDGCAEQPVTEIDRDEVALGGGAPTFLRTYAHGLALSGDLVERTDDARPSVALALSLAADPREEAAAWWVAARIDARQGRRAEALASIARAEAQIGPHPALSRLRGEAASLVWAWDDAAAAYADEVRMAPFDTPGWRDLARARGSLGDPRGALEAAVRGLAMQPRDGDLLRSQALALEALGDPRAGAAVEAWLTFRPPDDAADLRRACDEQVPGCARDRVPVPTVALSAVAPERRSPPPGVNDD